MIREPYLVYPYNTTIDTTLEKVFSFAFNGDQLRKYDYLIQENNNPKQIFKSFNSLIDLDKTYYNDELVNIPVELDGSEMGKNLVWKLRLVENNGDWTENNIPSMKISSGDFSEISETEIKGPIAGILENLTSEDLAEGTVSLFRNGNEYFKVKDYESRYYEYYTFGEGGYFIGEVIKKGSSEKFYWVEKTVTEDQTNKTSFVTRSSVNLEPITLEDNTGVFKVDNLFSESEFTEIFKSQTVAYEKTETLANYEVKVLESFGYNETPQKVYKVNAMVTSGSNKYSNPILRKTVGLAPYIYLRYKKTDGNGDVLEKGFEDIFTEAEFSALKGYSVSYRQVVDEEHPVKTYQIIEETSFNETDEILYTVTEHLTNYGTKLLSSYNKGEIEQYPVETEKQINRKDKISDKTSILVKDQNGNIFSSVILFTQEEIDKIIDLDYGIYSIENFKGNDFSFEDGNFDLYKNFYDSNFYYFQSRSKPIVTFVDDNLKPIPLDGYELDSRYLSLTVAEKDSINTKYFKWEVFRNDLPEPVFVTEKIFSQNIQLTYDNCLNDYNYNIVLTLGLQDGATYTYEIKNIIINYDQTIVINSSANCFFDKDENCVNVSWPSQKISIPEESNVSQDENWLNDKEEPAAIKIEEDGYLLYSDIGGEQLKIDPNNFIFASCFYVEETVYRDPLKNFDLFKLISDDNTNYFTLKKNGQNFKAITSKTSSSGVNFYEVDAEGIFDPQKILFTFLKQENDFIFEEEYLKENNVLKMFNLPEKDTILKDDPAFLFETDTNLHYIKLKVFVSKRGAVIFKYIPNETTWTLDKIFAIDNNDSLNRYDFKNIYFNKVYLFGPASYKYLVLYSLSNIRQLIEELEPNILDIDWSPTWDTIPEDKIISINYAEGTRSQYNTDINGEIKSYRIYRYEYSDAQRTELLDQTFLMELQTPDIPKINNNTSLLIKDYAAHNRGYFEYQIVPRIEVEDVLKEKTKILGAAIISNVIYIDNYYWLFTSLGKKEDGTYVPLEQWKFILDIQQGAYSHNIQKVFHSGFSQFPKVSVGLTDYITTTLSCYVGDFSFDKKVIYDTLKVRKGKTILTTSVDNLSRIYIEKTPELEDFNFSEDNATLEIKGQSRKITNYSFEYLEEKKYYYVEILNDFLNFIPQKDQDYIITLIKDKSNANEVIVAQNNSYKDNIHIVNKWNNFVKNSNLVLVKDIKGNCFIGVLSNNQENYNKDIDLLPTTVSFSITQIGNISDYSILGG